MAAYKDEARGTWYVSFYYNDWTGKNRGKLKRGFRARKEALEYEQKFRLQQATNLDMNFADFYKLYEDDMKPKLKLNTWRTKAVIFEKKLIPYFKDKKMNEISPADIIKWQNKMIKHRIDGKPYKPTYLKKMQSELSAIFNHAVRFYNLRENPVVKAGTIGKGKADEMNFWTKEEYLKFIACVKDKPISYYAFQILYWCGIREGELLALTPEDIDFENKKLHIAKSYQHINGEININLLDSVTSRFVRFMYHDFINKFMNHRSSKYSLSYTVFVSIILRRTSYRTDENMAEE